MFCTMCVQMINQAINLEVEDLVISTSITGIQWTYKILHLHQEGWDELRQWKHEFVKYVKYAWKPVN